MSKDILLAHLNMKQVLERYGIRADRERIPCPIHGGKNNNFQIYEKSFYCFKCGAGGDVIHFVKLYFRLDYITAARKMEYDFGLRVPTSLKERHRLKREEQNAKTTETERRRKERQCAACFAALCDYYHWLIKQPETCAILFDIALIDRRLDKMYGEFEPFDAKALVNALYTKHQKEGGVLFFE